MPDSERFPRVISARIESPSRAKPSRVEPSRVRIYQFRKTHASGNGHASLFCWPNHCLFFLPVFSFLSIFFLSPRFVSRVHTVTGKGHRNRRERLFLQSDAIPSLSFSSSSSRASSILVVSRICQWHLPHPRVSSEPTARGFPSAIMDRNKSKRSRKSAASRRARARARRSILSTRDSVLRRHAYRWKNLIRATSIFRQDVYVSSTAYFQEPNSTDRSRVVGFQLADTCLILPSVLAGARG